MKSAGWPWTKRGSGWRVIFTMNWARRSLPWSFRVSSSRSSFPQPPDAALAWAVREGATNVLRHSRATRCTIGIATKDGHLRLTVLDDGRGSETLDPGQGLRGLRERIEPLGGQLSTEDLAGGGFQLTVDVPIQQ